MSYGICKIKNETNEITTLNGKEFAIDEIFKIEDEVRISWATCDAVIISISEENFKIHDSVGEIVGISNQIDWLKEY